MLDGKYIPNDRKNLKRLKELTDIFERDYDETSIISKINNILKSSKPVIEKEKDINYKVKYYESLLTNISNIIENTVA